MMLITHPSNLEAIRHIIDKYRDDRVGKFIKELGQFSDFEIIPDRNIPATQDKPDGRIIFPEDKFVEYEASDYNWMSYFGLAKIEQEAVFYELNPRYLVEFDLPITCPLKHPLFLNSVV